MKLNMENYSHSHNMSSLIGSPQGYIGYGSGGVLTNFIIKNPNALVLLDEMEKAHPDVMKKLNGVKNQQIINTGLLAQHVDNFRECRKDLDKIKSELKTLGHAVAVLLDRTGGRPKGLYDK